MAASKGVKTLLKAAKAAVGKKDYQEVSRICQEVFAVDEGNYTGHVFAGLAALELGRHADAKQHYKTAITSQPDEPLAWKGLANYYDKHPPSDQDEVEDAIQTYQTLLIHVGSDTVKKRSTLSTLAGLWHRAGDSTQLAATYSTLISTYPPEETGGEEVTGVWIQLTTVLLAEKSLPEQAWKMLVRGVEVVLGEGSGCSVETRLDTRERFIPLLLDKYKAEKEESSARDLKDMLLGHCHEVLDSRPSAAALSTVAYLTLVDMIQVFPEQPGSEWMSEWTHTVLKRLREEKDGGGEGEGLGYIGMACVEMVQGHWRDTCTLLETGLSLGPSLCEAHLLLSWTHLKLHSFTAALQQAQAGLCVLEKFPAFLAEHANWKLKLLEAKSLLGLREDNHNQHALTILMELFEKGSCDRHVIVALTRVHLALGDIESAEKVVQSLQSSQDTDTVTANLLQGEICLTQCNYDQALTWFDTVLEQQDQCWSSECLLLKGLALWHMSDSVGSYATLLKAAKADPYNPDVILYIGHYQRQVAGDVSRALKCYQKAVQLQPDHIEALSCCGDLLFACGREEEAFEIYSEITRRVPAAKAKQALLRLGLYHRQKGQFNDAIYCFQRSLSADTSDKQCWECLAEAYLARGSHSSALKAFSKVVELDPESVYCLYQLGNIHQVRGELREAVTWYSSVLALQPNYLPALKGRGHTHYLLALSSLKQNFDARAVDHVALALMDLTRAASVKPRLLCIWKLIGNSCTCLHQVNPATARPAIPEVLLGKGVSVDTTAVVEKTELFLIGCKSYGRALQLSPESSSLWHDLSLAYYHLTQISCTEEKKTEYIKSAFNVIKKALSLSPGDHTHWNLLGVIAAHSAMDRPAVAQHSFITSLQLESNNGLAWTNLGALYLKHGQMELAHKAFRAAQSLDSFYAAAWIGQAIIAHRIGHEDCMDLYRHTTELEFHSEGSRGYGYWVCQTLTTLAPDLILEPGGEGLNLVAARGMLQARDCLQKYVEREPEDSWALNLLGLLYEQEGLLSQAERAFYKAGQLLGAVNSTVSASQCVAVNVNRARLLSALDKHTECLELWSTVIPTPTDLQTQLQLALALYRAGKYAESIQVYEGAVEVSDDKQKSAILCACAMVAYAQGDINRSKTFLFKAFEATPPSVHAMIGLCVIGSLTLDLTLLQTALLETHKIIEWKSGDGQLLHICCIMALRIIMEMNQSSECVEAASSIFQLLPDIPQYVQAPPLPITLPLLAASCHSGDSDTPLLSQAQKLLHSYPSSVWSMAALTHALNPDRIKTQYQAVLIQYIRCNLASLGTKQQAIQQLQTWVNE